jgi:hypothetical protein
MRTTKGGEEQNKQTETQHNTQNTQNEPQRLSAAVAVIQRPQPVPNANTKLINDIKHLWKFLKIHVG